jgi:hypothetical protein
MARIFENQTNGFRETIGLGDAFGALLLGPIWLIRRGVYAFGIILLLLYLPVLLGISFGNDNTAGFLFFLVLVPTQIILAFSAMNIISKHYARSGWREIEGTAPSSTGAYAEKTCPMCAETVKSAALICKHCGHQFATDMP